jgi:hypothetical protein
MRQNNELPLAIWEPSTEDVGRFPLQAPAGDGTAGKENRSTAPRAAFMSAHSLPPWASMIDREIDSPIPTPFDFVV